MNEFVLGEIADGVKALILESLDREGQDCELSMRIIEDLEAESLDYLDIAFRIERKYGVKMQRGRIEKSLRARLPGLTIKPNTEATDDLKNALKEFMPEISAERIDAVTRVKEISGLFTVATFVRAAVLAIGEANPEAKFVGDHVDGYTAWQLGVPVGGSGKALGSEA